MSRIKYRILTILSLFSSMLSSTIDSTPRNPNSESTKLHFFSSSIACVRLNFYRLCKYFLPFSCSGILNDCISTDVHTFWRVFTLYLYRIASKIRKLISICGFLLKNMTNCLRIANYYIPLHRISNDKLNF